jgi:hypothetical protein
MNSSPSLHRFLPSLPLVFVACGVAWLSTGCVTMPQEVKESVDETRTVVSELHKAHARDSRVIARLIAQREVYLREFGDNMRAAFRVRITAEAAASKTRTMAEYDRRAGELLGIQFQNQVRSKILPSFNPLERAALVRWIDANKEKSALANDPALGIKVTAMEREVLQTQHLRDEVIGGAFLSLEAALRNARFKFETEVNEKYNDKLKSFFEGLATELKSEQAREDFEQRLDAKLAQLDDAYYSVDHALSDLSTFLDSEASSRRFLKHTVKGFAGALVDDLKNGQLGGVALSDIFEQKSQGFSKDLQSLEASLQTKAETVAKEVAKDVADKLPTVPMPPAAAPVPITAKQ